MNDLAPMLDLHARGLDGRDRDIAAGGTGAEPRTNADALPHSRARNWLVRAWPPRAAIPSGVDIIELPFRLRRLP